MKCTVNQKKSSHIIMIQCTSTRCVSSHILISIRVELCPSEETWETSGEGGQGGVGGVEKERQEVERCVELR